MNNKLIFLILFLVSFSVSAFAQQAVDVTPNNPNTNNALTCSVYGGYIPDSYVWKVNGNQVSDLTSNTVPASRTLKGQTWSCDAIVNFGSGVLRSIGTDSVTISNTAPTLNPIPNAVVAVGTQFSYQVTASDIDSPNDALTYSIVSSPSSSISISSTGVISFTPLSVGIYSVTVSVTDSSGASATQAFTITSNSAVNTPPSFTTTGVPTGTVGILYTYDANATDPDGDPLTFSLVSAPVGMTIDSVTGIVSWIPSAAGVYNPITVGVSDGFVTVTQIYSINVGSIVGNQPPVFTSTPITIGTVGVPYVYDADAFDPDGDTLTYNVVGPVWMQIVSATGVIFGTPSLPGTYPITVEVDDGTNPTVTQPYTITVSSSGSFTVIASANQTSGNLPLTVSFSSVSSGGFGTVTYMWDFDGDFAIDSNNQNDVFTYLSPGTYFATVYASDSFGNSAQDTVQIDVTSTGVLAAFIVPDTTSGVRPLSVFFDSAVSGGTQPYSYAWDFNGDTVIDSAFSFDFYTYTPAGTYNVTLTVTDNLGVVSTDSVLITVLPQGPSITTTSCPDGEVDKSYTCDINAAGTGTLTYSLVTRPAGMTINSATGVISWTPTDDGPFSFRVRVTDPNGLTAERTYTIDVNDNKVQDGDLVVSSIKFLEDSFNQGGTVTAVVSLDNQGDIDAKDLIVTMSVEDLGVTTSTGKFTVKDGDKESKTLTLELPSQVVGDDYLVKFTIKNKDVSITKYKQITINGAKSVASSTTSNVPSNMQVNYQPSITSYQPTSSKAKTNWSGIWFMVVVLLLLFALVVYLARTVLKENKEDAVRITALDEF